MTTPTTAPPTASLERVRQRIGLSKTQLLRLATALGEFSPPLTDDALSSDQFAIRKVTEEIEAHWLRYLTKLEVALLNGPDPLTTIQLARILNLGEFHLAHLRKRGKLPYSSPSTRRALYPVPALLDMLRNYDSSRYDLARSFLRYVEAQEGPERYKADV